MAGVSSIAAANLWLPGFITAYNTRFGRDPANAKNLHRPLGRTDDLDEILAWREDRTVTRNLTLHYDRMMLLLDPTPLARGLVGNAAGRDRRQQTAVSRVGADQGAAGRLPGPSAARAYCAAADRRTTSRRQVCLRRGAHHATALPQLRPEAAIRTELIATAAFRVFH